MHTVGDRIKKARKDNNLTLIDIKNMTGLSTGNLSELENNKFMPSANALILLKKVLNVSIDWILMGEDKDLGSKEDFYPECIVKESKEEEYILSDNEKELIADYRKLTDEQQEHIMSFINICLKNMEK